MSRPAAAGRIDARAVDDPTTYPYGVVGRLYLTFASVNYLTTGWVIGERAVCTAGHCLYDPAYGWATNVLFQARGARRAWPLDTLATLAGWAVGEDFAHDFAIGIAPSPIRPSTGKAGYTINQSDDPGTFCAIGFPAVPIPGYAFGGGRMWECRGDRLLEPWAHAGLIAMRANFTDGAGGGPWFVRRNGQPLACGLTSFRYTAELDVLRSPSFGEPFRRLVQWMSASGGDTG
jgi:hypothetical protein